MHDKGYGFSYVGNAILHQLKHAGYDWMDMRHIFVTHKHVDHLLGNVGQARS